MSREGLSFPLDGKALVATLDRASGPVGLLIVSGGNEIRSGAFGGQAALARKIAKAGYPVFRFDRRGVGDSEGDNRGFRSSASDIAAALGRFRDECPGMIRVVAFGNCDAACALMLFGGAGANALVLANPWTFDNQGALPPPDAIRARYAAKLRSAREWKRLLRGGVDLRKLAAGLRAAAAPGPPPGGLLAGMRAGMAAFPGEYRFLIAGRDRTGLAFRSAWNGIAPMVTMPDADHSFSSAEASAWLYRQILSALEEQARQLDMR